MQYERLAKSHDADQISADHIKRFPMLTSRIPRAWDLTLKTEPSTLNTLNPQSLCPDLNLGLIGFRAIGFVAVEGLGFRAFAPLGGSTPNSTPTNSIGRFTALSD